ncbi:phosphatidylglycerophosphatase A [Candidatus Aerophobetes bacterium]|nr:phosphatidylglycerophosphatase A [Candidatus Aerophobetes bacterium]
MKRVFLAIGTGFGAGYVPFFPGTAGTLWGVLIYILISSATPIIWWHLFVAIFVIFLGVWVSGECEKILKDKDHRFIVIDEIGGFLIAMLGLPVSPLFLVSGFIFFRLFDMIKPFYINKLQKLPGGWGVVLDDAAAGLLANIFIRVVISMFGW